jgi:hypothetical protein
MTAHDPSRDGNEPCSRPLHPAGAEVVAGSTGVFIRTGDRELTVEAESQLLDTQFRTGEYGYGFPLDDPPVAAIWRDEGGEGA